jgi:iron complex outermembrane receptor protein
MKFVLNQFSLCHRLSTFTVFIGAIAAASLPITASAQDASSNATQLDPIVIDGSGAETISEDNDTIVPTRGVSASKTDTPLIETPRSVAVVTRKEMEQRHVTDLVQATRYSSGVTTGGFGYDPRFDQITIRGIETTTNGDFRDGLRQPVMTYGTFTTEIYTLDRVEVLKGPVSVMYGAASAAGIVNKVSKLPQEDAHHEVELQYGTIGRKQAAFDFGGPVGESDEMFYRVVGLVREGETNYDIADDRYLLQPSFTWKPDNSTKLTIYGLAQNTETDSSAWTFKNDGDLHRVSDPDYDYQKIRQFQLGYQFEHDFGNGLTFRQNARVSDLDLKARYVDRTTMFSDPTAPWGTAAVTDDVRAYQIDNQLQAKFDTGIVSHTFLAGLDYTGVNSDFADGYGTHPTGRYRQRSQPPTHRLHRQRPASDWTLCARPGGDRKLALRRRLALRLVAPGKNRQGRRYRCRKKRRRIVGSSRPTLSLRQWNRTLPELRHLFCSLNGTLRRSRRA